MLRFGSKAFALRKSWQERYTDWRDARKEVVVMGPDKFSSLTTTSYYVKSLATGKFFYAAKSALASSSIASGTASAAAVGGEACAAEAWPSSSTASGSEHAAAMREGSPKEMISNPWTKFQHEMRGKGFQRPQWPNFINIANPKRRCLEPAIFHDGILEAAVRARQLKYSWGESDRGLSD
jgi:hypothetical protein